MAAHKFGRVCGTSTQMGRNFTVRITIESYSPPEDQQVLLNAVRPGGTQAVFDALDRLPARGRLSLPGSILEPVHFKWDPRNRSRAVSHPRIEIAAGLEPDSW
jgi:hypothetical protein